MKEMLKCIVYCLFVLVLSSCSEKKVHSHEGQHGNNSLNFTDELGRHLQFDTLPQRILPLCASSMEFITLLCDSSQIIGRTTDVITPEWIKDKPVVVNYPLDIEKIVSLKPDLVVSKEGIVSIEQVHKLESLGLKVYMQKANSIKEIIESLLKLGAVLGKKNEGEQQANYLQAQFDSLSNNPIQGSKTALVFISTDPLYVYGSRSYLSDLLTTVGLQNAVDSTISQLYPMVDQEYVLKVNPDYFILPHSLEGSSGIFSKYPALKKTNAFQKQHCIYINDDWLSRPSPNIIKAAAYIVNKINEHEKK